MNIEELDEEIGALIVDGTLTLTSSSLGGLLQSFLTSTYQGPLSIAGATSAATSDSVTIGGTAPILGVAAVPVQATFTLGQDGSVQATLDWALPQAWTFATSFPSLPPFADGSSLLTGLQLTGSRYVVSTVAGTDVATGVPIAAGLNVIATLSPSNLFGLFETALGVKGPLILSGTIVLPQPAGTTPQLPMFTAPWETTWPVPGIDLSVLMGVGLTISGLQLRNVAVRVYSPTDTTWLATNGTYTPLAAVTGTLDIPSAGMSANVMAEVTNGTGVILDCAFSGATLSKLEQLSDLVNGNDLASILPSEVQSALGDIALEGLSIGFLGDLTASAVQFVAVNVGLPNLTWTLLSTPVDITVSNLDAGFIVVSPFTSDRSLSLTFAGEVSVAGASFDVITEYPGFAAYLQLEQGTTLSLQQTFSALAPSLPAPPDLTIDSLNLLVTPGVGYSFSATMADDPPWTLPVGPASMTFEAVSVDVEDAQGSSASGSFSGTIEFGSGIELSASYTVPGALVLQAEFPEVKLSQIIAQLDQGGITLPTGFDIDLEQAFALIEDQDSAFTFSGAAAVQGLGFVGFSAQENGGSWGFAAGVQLGSGSPSSVPGFGALAAIESFLGLQEILIVVSSLEQPDFQFPDMAAFNAPPLQGASIALPAHGGGLVKGVNVYASLGAASDAGLKLLAGFLGVSLDGSVGVVVSVSVPDPATSSQLSFAVDTDINESTHLQGQMGVQLTGGAASLFLTGSVTASIQGQPVTFDVTAAAFPTGVLISGSMQGTLVFAPLTLNNVALAIGIDDAAVPSVGFAANLDIAGFDSSIVLFLDSVKPSNSMFAGAVSDVTLLSVAESIAGQNDIPAPLAAVLAQFALKGLSAFQMPQSAGTSLDNRDLAAVRAAFAQGGVTLPAADDQVFFVVNTPGSAWHLTDLSQMLHYELAANGTAIDVALEPQIYYAAQATTIGTLQFPQGIHVLAEVDALLIQSRVQVEISPSQGISIDVSLAPIQVVSSGFFSITGAGPNGGPDLSLSTFGQPHFTLSGAMNILGAAAASIDVAINENGLSFDFQETVGPVQFDFSGSIGSSLELSISGNATIAINQSYNPTIAGVSLGTIEIELDVVVSAAVSSAGGGTATVSGSFEFQGLSLSIPSTTLDISGPALANLVEVVGGAVEQAILGALSAAGQYLTWVKNQVITGAAATASEVGTVLSRAYNLAADDIAAQTQQILGYTVDEATQALQGAGVAAEDAANALVGAGGYAANEVSQAVGTVFGALSHADFGFHVDTPGGPHLDTTLTPHVDTPSPHVDIAGAHTDFNLVGHEDVQFTPHVDTNFPPHVDAAAQHGDASVPPHIDTGTHVDT